MSPLFCLVDFYLASLTFRSFRLNCKVLNFVNYNFSRLPDIPSVCLWLLLSPCSRSRATPSFFSLPLLPMTRSFLVSLLLSFPHPCSSPLTFTYSKVVDFYSLISCDICAGQKVTYTVLGLSTDFFNSNLRTKIKIHNM